MPGTANFNICGLYSLFCRSGDSDEFDIFFIEILINVFCIQVYCYHVVFCRCFYRASAEHFKAFWVSSNFNRRGVSFLCSIILQ